MSAADDADFERALDLLNQHEDARALAIALPWADRGHAGFQYIVGECYSFSAATGRREIDLACHYFELATKQGHGRAAFMLWQFREWKDWMPDQPVTECLAAAIAGLSAAAANGDAGAMCDLAFMYHHGVGQELDGHKAIYWYQRALNTGQHGAANGLYQVYYECADLSVRDKKLARQWFDYAKAHHVDCIEIWEFDKADGLDKPRGWGI